VERLSSGLRINRAKDDVAGLGISQELQRQTRSFAVATRNANDAISMVQTAEGAMQSVSDMLIRLKELTTQGANESLSKEQRSFITGEINQLRKEINAVAERTTFNNTRLLTGDFSEAVKGEFIKVTELDGTNNSVLGTSTVKLDASSEFIVDIQKSIMSIADLQVDDADEGSYTLRNNGASVVLSRTVGNSTESQTLTLVSGAATSPSQVALNNDTNGTMTLNFSDFGVSITVKNDRVGTADGSVSEIATKIASIGVTPNEDYKNKGWKAISGADWATGGGTLKAVITSSGGQIRTTSTAGLSSVTGYAALGTSQLDATSGRYEMAFSGTAAQLNAALATLQVNNTTGLGEITVDILPDGMSVFTNPTNGITSYYQVVTNSLTWNNARTAAKATTFNGLTGYLTNVTSANEHNFIAAKVQGTAWIGAYEPTTDGVWVWADGPEGGQQFWQGGIAGTAVAGGAGQVSTAYANWAPSQPDSGGILAGANLWALQGYRWDDLLGAGGSAWNGPSPATSPQYIIEYGGVAGVSANTSKTLLIGTPGYINVGDAVEIEAVATSGVGANSADTGIYKLSADTAAKTVTLKRFDVDGETLLGSQTLSKPDGLGAGRYTTLAFESMGVSLTISNSSDRAITLGGLGKRARKRSDCGL